MTAVPTPVLLLTLGLAVVAVVVLWKLLMVAGLIGLAQWAVIAQTDDPTAVLLALGLPALALALLLRRRGRTHHARSPFRSPLYLHHREVTR